MPGPEYGGQAASRSLAGTFGPDDRRGRGGAPSPLRDGGGAGEHNEDLTAEPTPVDGDPVDAWGDMTEYFYVDKKKTVQGPFGIAEMRSWVQSGYLTLREMTIASVYVTYQFRGGIRE